jgi:predicted nucleotidyltransferase
MQMNNPQQDLEKPTQRILQTLAKDIARKFHPQRIILFGSYAYGQPTRESDVDLLVIMQTTLRPIEQAVAIRQAVNTPFPMDLLVRTPEQIESRLSLGDYFFKEIVSRGRVLYEADHT